MILPIFAACRLGYLQRCTDRINPLQRRGLNARSSRLLRLLVCFSETYFLSAGILLIRDVSLGDNEARSWADLPRKDLFASVIGVFSLDMVFVDILVFCGILLYDVVIGELNVGVLNFDVNVLE